MPDAGRNLLYRLPEEGGNVGTAELLGKILLYTVLLLTSTLLVETSQYQPPSLSLLNEAEL